MSAPVLGFRHVVPPSSARLPRNAECPYFFAQETSGVTPERLFESFVEDLESDRSEGRMWEFPRIQTRQSAVRYPRARQAREAIRGQWGLVPSWGNESPHWFPKLFFGPVNRSCCYGVVRWVQTGSSRLGKDNVHLTLFRHYRRRVEPSGG